MTTILIADDHPIVRSGLKQVLEEDKDLEVVFETDNGESALQLIRQSTPGIAILDVEMPKMDGLSVAEHVGREDLATDVIIMTMHDDEQTVNKAMDLGVKGFVLKENAVADIVNAVHAVRQGKHYFSPSLFALLLRKDRRTPEPSSPLTSLTPTERTILNLIAEQKTTKTIALELNISPKTVEKHRSNICGKLDLHGVNALLKFALQLKDIR